MVIGSDCICVLIEENPAKSLSPIQPSILSFKNEVANNENVDIKLMHTTRFWNNLHQVHNNLYQVRNNLHQVRNNLHQVRNNLHQVG